MILESNILTVGSKESILPAISLQLNAILAGAKFDFFEINYLISNYKDFIDNQRRSFTNKPTENYDPIKKFLNINKEHVPLEGMLGYKLGRIEGVMPFSNQSIQQSYSSKYWYQ